MIYVYTFHVYTYLGCFPIWKGKEWLFLCWKKGKYSSFNPNILSEYPNSERGNYRKSKGARQSKAGILSKAEEYGRNNRVRHPVNPKVAAEAQEGGREIGTVQQAVDIAQFNNLRAPRKHRIKETIIGHKEKVARKPSGIYKFLEGCGGG